MGIEGFRQRSERGCLGGGGVAVVQTERCSRESFVSIQHG